MHLDPMLPVIVASTLVVVVIGFLFHITKQPHVIGYLLVGIIIGPSGLGLIEDKDMLNRLGTIGVDLLLFFIGMEISPRNLVKNWKVPLIGTTLQISLSIIIVLVLGLFMDWSVKRIITLGFVISLSSTAVVITVLRDWNELNTKIGQNALGVLLVQDMAIIPMLIVVNTFSTKPAAQSTHMALQVIGGVVLFGIVAFIIFFKKIRLPFSTILKKDRELQVFTSLGICFGLALVSALFGLSTALGAFIAGMFISSAKETEWVHKSLEPFRVFFVALFFASVGLMIQIKFLIKYLPIILLLVVVVIILNTIVNASIFKIFKGTWSESLYFGALLSQIGEFSFLIVAIGHQEKIITEYGYQITIALVALTLFMSPFWIALNKRIYLRFRQ